MASSDGEGDRREIELSRMDLNTNMVGIGLAIFTFLLLFVFSGGSSSSSGQRGIDSLLFQVALGLIVAAVFSFGFAGLYNYVLVYSVPAKHPKARSHCRRASVFFGLGVLILLLEPALILFSFRLNLVAVVSLIFFFAYLIFYLKEDSTIRKIQNTRMG